MIWRCPRCRMELTEWKNGVKCTSCEIQFERLGGVLDLRVPEVASFDYEADTARARRLLSDMGGRSALELIHYIFSAGGEWDEAWAEGRKRRVLNSVALHRRELNEWLQPCMRNNDRFLDLGCGTGTLLSAAAREGWQGIGIDASMTLLVIARQLILENGGQPELAAAFAEALPLADNAVSGVISLDVIEHVDNPAPYLREINRVTKPGGVFAMATPNRFSLTAEPHVGVWGVGWLPQSLQARYVKWRSGKEYRGTRLLSTWEASRLLRQHTDFHTHILIPSVAEEEIAHFPPRRAALARFYNRALSMRWTKWPFLLICPFFRIIGIKEKG